MKKHLWILGVCFLATAVLSLPACKGKSANERLAERVMEKATGGKAEVDMQSGTLSIKTADGELQVGSVNEWPADVPGDVPKFEGAKISNAARTSQGAEKAWIINFKDAEETSVTQYIDRLKASGFTSDILSQAEESMFFQCTKGDVTVMLAFSKTDGELNINVAEKE
ncbi:MAG TPA: hypothetical protein PLX50_03510 [Candidatus Aminicenantes bacterium]|nr:hypothetical protein [Candidatus Aminicenantes bacterium]